MAAIPDTDSLTDREQRALELIQTHGGIHQSEFWKELDVSSRTGSRIITNLLEKDLVTREDAVHNGRKTYFIEVIPDPAALDFSLLMAGDMLSPFIGEEEVDPQSDAFSQWILNLERDSTNPDQN